LGFVLGEDDAASADDVELEADLGEAFGDAADEGAEGCG